MSLGEIRHEAPIKAPPAAVYTALTDPAQLARWWIPDTRGDSRVGGVLEFRIGEFCQPMEVLALEPDRQVRWRAPGPGPADWADSEIAFDIQAEPDGCRLGFRHSGLPEGMEKLPYYSLSWAVFLLSLKALVETGEGFPFPNRWINA